jgi:Family of unknown function (DUF6152)
MLSRRAHIVVVGLAALAAGIGLGSVARGERPTPTPYDTSTVIELEGSILALRWVEPEVGIDLLARDGRVWRIALGSISNLQGAGMHRQTLGVGAELVVAGFPAADGDAVLYATNALPSGGNEVLLRTGSRLRWKHRR